MARLSTTDKCIRVLLLLLGLRERRIAAALAAHGFDAAQLARGWFLLSQMTAGRLDSIPTLADPRLLRELDAWENKWFPIIEVVLRTHFPEIRRALFRNIAQTEGHKVVISVGTLLERIGKMGRSAEDGGFGEEGQRARDRLEARGLTPEVVAEAEGLLAALRTIEPLDEEDDDPAGHEQAEKELWRWYLEWSGIARSVIRERRLLRALGFRRGSKRKGSAEEESASGDEEDET